MSTATVQWRKSTYSGNQEHSNCVEAAPLAGTVGVRDSKDTAYGHLNLPALSWSALTQSLKD